MRRQLAMQCMAGHVGSHVRARRKRCSATLKRSADRQLPTHSNNRHHSFDTSTAGSILQTAVTITATDMQQQLLEAATHIRGLLPSTELTFT